MTEHKPGDFRLMPISGDVGKLIRYGQWWVGDKLVPVQHAHVYLGDNMFMDAEPGGAKPQRYADLDSPNTFWSTDIIPLTDTQRSFIVEAANGYAGTPYSFLDYYAIAAKHYHIPMPGVENYIKSTKHMICSQLTARCYSDAGVYLFDDHRWTGYDTPADLYWRLKGIQDKG